MSFRDKLSNFWGNVQSTLFPTLENTFGELSPDHKKLTAILELVRIEEWVPSTFWNFGRPSKDKCCIARAFIAKIVFKIPFTKQLIRLLKSDRHLRIICGWDGWSKIPSESKFSRVFKEFALYSLPEKVHQALIKEVYKGEIVGHVVKDSTPIEVREKAFNKKENAKDRKKSKDRNRKRLKKAGEPNRRQKQLKEKNLDKLLEDLPKQCDRGMKKSAQGYTTIWKGYKLHVAIDDNCIALAAIVTSASLNDCEAAIPLATKSNQVAKNLYDLMDAAYDHTEIKEHSISLGHVPIIDRCPHNPAQKEEKEAEKKRRKSLNFQTAEDKRYRERFPKERFNALYKDYHGGRNMFFRGYLKVSCHVMFGVLVVTASTLINLVQ
jgi:DDE family transposase/transposase-like protein DUF772